MMLMTNVIIILCCCGYYATAQNVSPAGYAFRENISYIFVLNK